MASRRTLRLTPEQIAQAREAVRGDWRGVRVDASAHLDMNAMARALTSDQMAAVMIGIAKCFSARGEGWA